jgi:hypothetical protein
MDKWRISLGLKIKLFDFLLDQMTDKCWSRHDFLIFRFKYEILLYQRECFWFNLAFFIVNKFDSIWSVWYFISEKFWEWPMSFLMPFTQICWQLHLQFYIDVFAIFLERDPNELDFMCIQTTSIDANNLISTHYLNQIIEITMIDFFPTIEWRRNHLTSYSFCSKRDWRSWTVSVKQSTRKND